MPITLFDIFEHYNHVVVNTAKHYIVEQKNIEELLSKIEGEDVSLEAFKDRFWWRFSENQLNEIDPTGEMMLTLSETFAQDLKAYVEVYLRFKELWEVK